MTTKKSKKIKTTTLKELGPNLPLGIVGADGGLTKAIDVRPWRMKEEKELGKLRDENPNENTARWVTTVLAHMCTQLGNLDLSSMKMSERKIHIGQMTMGDVFYAYMWLRYKSLGPLLEMEISHCRNEMTIKADLESLAIDTADKYNDTFWEYKLQDPFEIRNKKAKKLLMAPPRWNAFENQNSTGALDVGAAKSGVITGSILKVVGIEESIVLNEDELDEMSKTDLETLTTLIDENHVGPDLSIEGSCPICRRSFKTSIDWMYDNFFGVSSR